MARIFIAIRFNDDVKNTFVNIQNALRTKGVRGNYCPYNNLHLTLAFIGEKYDLQNIYKAVSEVTFKPFTMTLGELGTFPTEKRRHLVRDKGERARHDRCQQATRTSHSQRCRFQRHDFLSSHISCQATVNHRYRH